MHCANPSCRAEALYLRGGSIYAIDRESAMAGSNDWSRAGGQRKMIWLCPDCSRFCVVETWRQPGQQLRWPNRPMAGVMRDSPPGQKVAA